MLTKRLFVVSVLLSSTAITPSNAQESKSSTYRSLMPGSKMAVEVPLKRLISTGSSPLSVLSSTPQPLLSAPAATAPYASKAVTDPESRLEGKRVQAGLVNWAPNATIAYQRARKSGKPVLVFQMIGKLDDEFC